MPDLSCACIKSEKGDLVVIVHASYRSFFLTTDVRFAHPFTCVVSGPTVSGKTEFVAKLIEYISDMMVPVPEKIVWLRRMA